jgi:hypothetical protein
MKKKREKHENQKPGQTIQSVDLLATVGLPIWRAMIFAKVGFEVFNSATSWLPPQAPINMPENIQVRDSYIWLHKS